MKGVVAYFSFILVVNIRRKPIIELSKLAKTSCKLFGYAVIPDPFHNLRSSKTEKMKGVDATRN